METKYLSDLQWRDCSSTKHDIHQVSVLIYTNESISIFVICIMNETVKPWNLYLFLFKLCGISLS